MMSLYMLEGKPFEKTHVIHNIYMTFSSDASLCLEGFFHKRCIAAPRVILSFCKHASDLCFITSYFMMPESGEQVSGCGLLSVSCPIAQGTFLWYLPIFADLTHPEMQP